MGFQDGGFDGFVLEQTRENYISGSYYERLSRVERIVDPFGRESVFERLEYRRSEFLIADAYYGLEIVNPNKSVHRLISRLIEVADYRLSLHPASVDPLAWAIACSELVGERYKIETILLADVALEGNATATISVKGGEDALAASRSVLNGRSGKTEKVQIRFAGRLGRALFNANGMVVTSADPSGPIMASARSALLSGAGNGM
ncbi:hypothetical protein ASE23_12870 [Rhizobium sp. Root73]|nr:hypothetical protein ASD36_15060 [Rhizobium sp. Root1334]KRC00327.1 hypothetical protein ASE23_12870 [Rhizobium sp. Root73]